MQNFIKRTAIKLLININLHMEMDEMYVSARSTAQIRKNHQLLGTSHALNDRIETKDR